MSNDNKTLADVQPGGRVRLGDPRRQWLEIRGLASAIVKNLESFAASPHKAAWCGALDDSLTFADQIEKDAAAAYEAALSAQTSPGGQDARAQFEEYRGGDCERDAQGYYVNARTAQDWALWQAALAARQSAGEPAAWVHEEDPGRVISARQKATALRDQGASGSSVRPYSVPAYLHSPAQAVDLADFKALYRAYVRLLESGRDRIRDLGGTCDPVDVMEANDVDLQAARRVLDSQAVGK